MALRTTPSEEGVTQADAQSQGMDTTTDYSALKEQRRLIIVYLTDIVKNGV